jgi:hypothetical protein
MIDLQRRWPSGEADDTVADYIETRPYDIDGDGEALWRIIPTGRGFGFEGPELAEFVRLCVMRLLEAGAVPVRHGPHDAELQWKEQTQYGTKKEEIADAIIAEWLASGGGDPPLGISLVRDAPRSRNGAACVGAGD